MQSRDSQKNHTVSLTMNIPWKCSYVKYYVSSINTNSNILLSTKDDYMKYQVGKTVHTIEFSESYHYSIKQLEQIFSQKSELAWEYDKNKRTFKITASLKTTITSISHRAALLTGLYNTPLPLTIDPKEPFIVPDLPIITHTKLYLVSLQGNPMYSAIGDQEYTPSVIGNINTMAIDGKPLIYDFEKEGKPIKIKTNTDSLKYLELSLVDFQFQPIALKSPLFVSIKVKPAKDADVKDVLTK